MKAVDYKKLANEQLSESEFQSRVINLARATGWEHYHTHDSRRSPAGFPDLKREKGRVSEEQLRWIQMLTAAGQDACIWRPSDWEQIVADLSS